MIRLYIILIDDWVIEDHQISDKVTSRKKEKHHINETKKFTLNIKFSKVSQSQKGKYCMIPPI